MTDPTYDVQRQWEDMDPKTAHINQQAARIEALEAQVKAAVEALDLIDGKICWEINPSNYDHDDVCNMNADWCEVGAINAAALAQIKGGQ